MYPPSASVQKPSAVHTKSPSTESVVSEQPTRSNAMSLNPAERGESKQTLRLRGGCLACPCGDGECVCCCL